MRPTPCSSGRHGRIAKVVGSGMATMSDSSIGLKPVIEEPSNEMPCSSAWSSWSRPIENDFSWPRMSVNHRRTKRRALAPTSALTSSGVRGRSGRGAGRLSEGAWPAGPVLADRWAGCEPRLSPALELVERGLEGVAHGGEAVGHAHRRAGVDGARDQAAALELLDALGEEAVGQVGDRGRDLAEAQRAVGVSQHFDDRAGPSAADELDRLVEVRTAASSLGRAERRLPLTLLQARHGLSAYAASWRDSSTEPSTGTSPATLTIAVNCSRA